MYPQDFLDLKKSTRDYAVTSMSLPGSQLNECFVAGEDGSLAQVSLHGAKTGIVEVRGAEMKECDAA